MTFNELLQALKEFKTDRTREQLSCLVQRIQETWGVTGVLILDAALICSVDETHVYIPDDYDRFTIASLIAGVN